MEETKAAVRARLWGRLAGVRPPPIRARPPTAVRPDGETTKIKKHHHRNGGGGIKDRRPDLRWRLWQTWGGSAERGSHPTLCDIPQSQRGQRLWPSEWTLRWERWCPEPDRWKFLRRQSGEKLSHDGKLCTLFVSLMKKWNTLWNQTCLCILQQVTQARWFIVSFQRTVPLQPDTPSRCASASTLNHHP